MTTSIIIVLCSLILIAYLFDITSAKTKIPSVILLLLLGWLLHQATAYFNVQLPDLSSILPILGTIGLILIVLEGALELELDRSKSSLIRKSFITSLWPMLALAFILAYQFTFFEMPDFRKNLINIIPFCVISSAIAIPSAKGLSKNNKEFIIYESSFSDILGVLFFNFVALHQNYNLGSIGEFLIQIVVITVVSFVATLGLSLMMNRINHHTKFVPIILLIILIYDISKIYHLPGLIFILIFGLFLGNLDKFKHWKWIEKLRPMQFEKEVSKFKDLTYEAAFLIRSLFFLVFGFLIETKELLNPDSFFWAIIITAGIFSLRAVALYINKLPFMPLLFIAPRGLITILLFLSIAPEDTLPDFNKPLIIQVIVLTAIIMMLGIMFTKKEKTTEPISSVDGPVNAIADVSQDPKSV